jgi:protein-S-isoprenylcysteine O-methyltransferase Ste14
MKAPTLPRSVMLLLAVTVWPSLVFFAHAFLPWVLSWQAARLGWVQNYPAWWNWIGILLVALGTALVLWFWWVHVRQVASRNKLALKPTPDYLLTRGPYRFSRNPAYVGAVGIWLGWTVFYGSCLVGAGALALFLLFHFAVIPTEERGLAAAFGQAYVEYQASVPRWLGKIRS